jgi:hypothetical protein
MEGVKKIHRSKTRIHRFKRPMRRKYLQGGMGLITFKPLTIISLILKPTHHGKKNYTQKAAAFEENRRSFERCP